MRKQCAVTWMSETVLFVDDEENILRSIERLFMDKDLTLRSVTNAKSALSVLQQEDVAVIVSDNMMPGMSGLDLLYQVRDISPSTVKVLMTAYADLGTAVEAINKSEIFRFVLKPWDNNELEWVVEESLARYRIIQALSRGTESTLLSLAQTIELKDPYTRGHCERVGEYAVAMARRLGFAESACHEIRHGCWLHDCGKIGVPREILNFRGPLDASQYATVKNHPAWGAEVARQGRLSKRVINIILHHHERFDGYRISPSAQGAECAPGSPDYQRGRCLRFSDHRPTLSGCPPQGRSFTDTPKSQGERFGS